MKLMINFLRRKHLLLLKGIINQTQSSAPQCFQLFKFTSLASSSTGNPSFTVSYLVDNLGFSLQSALKVSKTVQFDTPQKPEAAFTFFRDQGFSDSQITHLFTRLPNLLLWDTHKILLPKFQFFTSKGASTTDIVRMVQKNPVFLTRSLENHIIPTFAFLRDFCKSDKALVNCIKRCPSILVDSRLIPTVNLLIKNGVAGRNIGRILSCRPHILQNTSCIMKVVDEVKALGFSPLKQPFGVALIAKMYLDKCQWDAKVDVYKKWGWSEEASLQAFRNYLFCMLASKEKIDKVMSFWVEQLGWSSLHLVNDPMVFGYSLSKRTVPRSLVLQYLLSKGLIRKSSSLTYPLNLSDEDFLKKYVSRFEKYDDQILELYEEKLKYDGKS